ncbi:translation initiation factor IF-2 N-terminal domain-containing protein [Microbacterium sp. LWS13-1.2]|uniref:Translation initiation factor IF-2 N-terminal domain-containing protein n=1 Tax=Microbacterium sp. LWS13-1.2 TaxID=3135264 RepID=A0AAU6SFX1_9MICO
MGVVAELSPSLSGVDARQQGAESTRPGPRPRVHELAAELGVDIAIVFAKLRDLGEPARNPSSALDPSVAVKVRAELRGG